MTTSDLGLGGGGPDVEVYVGAALAHTGGALDTQHLASTVTTLQYSTVHCSTALWQVTSNNSSDG